MADFLLAIDQGTTSTRAILFDAALTPVALASQELPQIYPAPGWVEHDPEEIWSATIAIVREAMAKAGAQARDKRAEPELAEDKRGEDPGRNCEAARRRVRPRPFA